MGAAEADCPVAAVAVVDELLAVGLDQDVIVPVQHSRERRRQAGGIASVDGQAACVLDLADAQGVGIEGRCAGKEDGVRPAPGQVGASEIPYGESDGDGPAVTRDSGRASR